MRAAAFQTSEKSWIVAHEALSRLAKARAMADAEEGRWLLAAQRAAVHVHLAMGSFGEYVERLFGYSRRLTREKLRVAEALEELPELMRALEAGVLSWSAARELRRVAVRETEREWLAVAQGKTVRQLEELVAGRSPGDRPDTPANDSARRHVLRFEVEAETFALFRHATVELRRRAGSSLSDDDVLLEMARQVLGGPRDEGRSSYQIAVTVCAECRAARQDAGSDTVVLGAEVLEMASCDAQHLGRVDGVPANDAQGRVESRTREVIHENDARAVHVGRGSEQGAPTPNDARSANGNTPKTAALESNAPARGVPLQSSPPRARVSRATQSIPPALRRAVLRRDQGRCRVPGCGNCAFVDVHHIVPRSEGGLHGAGNLIAVCGAHHRALHGGALAVERDGSAVHFRCADGSVYGGVANPTILDTVGRVSSALRNMGFREGEVRRALAEVRQCAKLEQASVQEWLRAALARLVPTRH